MTRRLLVVAPYFPPHAGGVEHYAYNVAARLARDFGWHVAVAASGQSRKGVTREMLHGITVYRLPTWITLSNTPLNPCWLSQLRNVVSRERPDVINAHAPVPGLSDIAIFGAKRIPTVLTYHMGSMRKGRLSLDWAIWLYERGCWPLTVARSDLVVCTSRFVRSGLGRQGRAKSTVVTPGVDTGYFSPVKEIGASSQRTDKPAMVGSRVLFVGALGTGDAHKGLSYLLRAFARVRKTCPGASLSVVGDGDDCSRYKAERDALGVSDCVRFLGLLRGRALLSAYQAADLLVLPSTNENFPLVLLEAMSCGLPVVASRVGGIPEIVADGKTGHLVQPTDVAALATRILDLVRSSDTRLRMGRLARDEVVLKHDWDRRAKQTHDLLSAVERRSYRPPYLSPRSRTIGEAGWTGQGVSIQRSP